MLYKHLVNGRGAGAVAAIGKLVGRVAYDDVKLHVLFSNLLFSNLPLARLRLAKWRLCKHLGHALGDVAAVDKGVGVALKRIATVKGGLAGAAVAAFARIVPTVLGALEPDIARIAAKALCNRALPLRVAAAVHAAPRQQAGKVGDAYAKYLPR